MVGRIITMEKMCYTLNSQEQIKPYLLTRRQWKHYSQAHIIQFPIRQ